MSKMDWLILVSASLSLLLPLAIFAIRQTVKTQRQGIIKDLEATFRMEKAAEGREGIVPSFEFVKFKYFINRRQDDTREHGDIPGWSFAIASLPLILSLFLFGIVAFSTLLTKTLPQAWEVSFLPPWYRRETDLAVWLTVLIVAYLASYLYVIRTLLRAVENFDLSPTSFLSAAIHVLFGAVTAVVVASAASEIFPGGTTVLPVLVIAAFAIGYVPDLGLRTLLRSTQLSLFKREDEQVVRAFSATPIEVIDGIDSEVRSRLVDHHIVTVQNLATANPIMLFVETPYGVYQIIDWVAQAQLCSAVGPKILVELWKLEIRTIFDLERAVLDESISTGQLRGAIGEILVSQNEAFHKRLAHDPEQPPNADRDATVKAIVEVMVDDLPTQRLRQIWNRISERLGEDNLRLRSIGTRRIIPRMAGAIDMAGADRRAA